MAPVNPKETARVLLRRHARQAQTPDPRREALLAQVRSAVPDVAREFGATRVFLFGSVAWGGVHAHSDVDLGVEGILPKDVDGFAARLLWNVDADVQVVAIEDAPAGLRDRILRDGLLIYDATREPGHDPDAPEEKDSKDRGDQG